VKRGLALALAACAALVALVVLGPTPEDGPSGGPELEPRSPRPAPHAREPEPRRAEANEPESARQALAERTRAGIDGELKLWFVAPTGSPLDLTGTARFVDGAGAETRVELQEQRTCALELAAGSYAVTIVSDEVRPFEASIVVDGLTERECPLWPRGWIGIDVVSAVDLEADKRFRDAFEALGAERAPDSDSQRPRPALGRFVRARDDPVSQRVGYLELDESRPSWVALACRGAIVGWEPLEPRQWIVTFEVSPDAILGETSALVLRAVDERGTPLAGVEACLTADERSKWRPEHCELETATDGRLELGDLFAGSYLLALERRGASLLVKRVEVPAAALVDLGDIVLPALPVLRVQVVDVEGEPRPHASVEVGLADCPYGEDRAFATRRAFLTDEHGIADVLRPPLGGVLRASTLVLDAFGGPATYSRIEPIPPPGADGGELVRLVVRERVEVAFDVGLREGRIEIRDELGRLRVEAPVDAPTVRVALVPDLYSAEHLDAGGRRLARARFEAGGTGGDTVILR
jgi:hypothetical protein